MKKGIHPDYKQVTVRCHCGNEFVTGSTKEYLDFVMEQLSGLDEVSSRAMMGEYILYYRGRIFGGVYDDRLLVKPVPMALRLMPRWNSRIMALKK